jgi:hypothetical protein
MLHFIFSATSKKSLNINANLDLHLPSHRNLRCARQNIVPAPFRTSNQGTRVPFRVRTNWVTDARGTSNTYQEANYNHSSCPTPHLQVSLRNPHPHHILPYLHDRRRHLFQPIPSSLPIMPPHAALQPPTEHSPALRPDK